MQLPDLLSALRMNRDFVRDTVAWEKIPPRRARFAELEHRLNPDLLEVLNEQGKGRFYTHQAAAINAILDGKNCVVATPTASGKTICYTVPTVETLLTDPNAKALYLFPTKALAQDQLANLNQLVGQLDELALRPAPLVATYDGDTPRHQRTKIRKHASVIISNPDMLHGGILPYHTQWRSFFANLRYIVLDEIHTYRGVFGSHIANLLRRFLRICAFYGSEPQFICASATIANPKEHAEKLTERPFSLIDQSLNGAPQGEKQFILYNPPMIDEELGLRRSSVLAAKDAASTFLFEDIQTVVFARARNTVELLLNYIRDELVAEGKDPNSVMGYRGGYLPLERRQIETGLREGELRGVVATNALELGVDIGQLESAVLTGYPGSVASTWQQAGRAGRRSGQSAVIMIASPNPIDQYICKNPTYLFGKSPEHALINPDNLRLMTKHLLTAAYELPFKADEEYGNFGKVTEVLDFLEEEGAMHETNGNYHFLGDNVPAHTFSLRTSSDDTVVIQADWSHTDSNRAMVTLGELDLNAVPTTLYEGAIYMHQGATFMVDHLDYDGRIATVREVDVDYYTRASTSSVIQELLPEENISEPNDLLRAHGECVITTKATGYRKIKRYSHETLGYGEIDLPEQTLYTQGYWFVFGKRLTNKLMDEGILIAPNDYGENWLAQRALALDRDGHVCRTCGTPKTPLHVHHIRPFREYLDYRDANKLDNLATLCASCHRRAEAPVQTRSAMGGLAHILRNLAPLHLMCDPSDINVNAQTLNPLTKAPTIIIYEAHAGIGFSKQLYKIHDTLLREAHDHIVACSCPHGCPACVGPPTEITPRTKTTTRLLLEELGAGK